MARTRKTSKEALEEKIEKAEADVIAAKKRYDQAVQMMADSKVAGVMFTVNIANGDDSTIMIEGSWGLGE